MNDGFKERVRAWWKRRYISVIILLFVTFFLLLYLWPYMFFTVESGHAGVVFLRFFGGTVTRTVRDEGFQIIAPWDKLTIYDVRVQQKEHSFHVISSNGLDINVVVSIRYHPKVELVGVLHKEIGPDYLEKIVTPEVQALIRNVFGHYSPEEMYTTKRALIEQTLQGALGQIGENFIVLDDLLIKSVQLPAGIQAAIEAKLIEEQRALEMKFRIDREKQEAERKVIEATGVHLSQEIIGQSLTDQLLQYKGIEATLKLAESPNAKVVVIGGKNGLPIILDAAFSESAIPTMVGISNILSQVTNAVSQAQAKKVPLQPRSSSTNQTANPSSSTNQAARR